MTRKSPAFMGVVPQTLIGDPLYETRLDRELRGGEQQGLARDIDRHAVDLEHDAAGLDPANPQLGRPLALAHAHLDRLRGNANVGVDADPDAAGALHVARHGAPRRLDLARRDPVRLHRLEAVLAEIEFGPGLGLAVNAPLVRLAEFRAVRLQHGPTLSSLQEASRRGRPASL